MESDIEGMLKHRYEFFGKRLDKQYIEESNEGNKVRIKNILEK